MEKSILFFFSIALLATSMPVDACINIPSLDIARACHEASTSTRMYDLCMQMKMFSGFQDNSEVLTYAVTAASAAARAFEFTEALGDNLISNPSTSGDMKAACKLCMRAYGKAQKLVHGVVGDLQGCFFDNVQDGCVQAAAAIDDCVTEVMRVSPGDGTTPFHDIVLKDRDRVVLALRLIGLFHH